VKTSIFLTKSKGKNEGGPLLKIVGRGELRLKKNAPNVGGFRKKGVRWSPRRRAGILSDTPMTDQAECSMEEGGRSFLNNSTARRSTATRGRI